MKTLRKKAKYIEWLSAEVMHENSTKWLSELKFINDELRFFDDLIKAYTLQLINSKHFNVSKKVVDKLGASHKQTNNLIEVIQSHRNDLEIMVDGIDQLKEEEGYKKEHREFIIKVNTFFKKHRVFKKELFDLTKNILKEQKQKRLLK